MFKVRKVGIFRSGTLSIFIGMKKYMVKVIIRWGCVD